MSVLGFLLHSSRGYWFAPWKSPYLRWRIETYHGTKAQDVDFREFWRFLWAHRNEMMRFLGWARRMRKRWL